jgi:hypothetical protein
LVVRETVFEADAGLCGFADADDCPNAGAARTPSMPVVAIQAVAR